MPNALDLAMRTQQVGIGKGRVGEPPRQPGKTGVKITAAIFFDGTGNNRYNVENRFKDSSYKTPSWYQSNDDRNSYAQYYSNVAILFFMHRKKIAGERIASVYVEGIGTGKDQDDDTPGLAFGSGPTGIVDRVTEGINKLRDEINNFYTRN